MSSPLTPIPAVFGTASFQTCGSAIPAATIGWLKDLQCCNTTAAAVQIYVCLVPSGSSPTDHNPMIYGYTIPAYGFLPLGGLNVMLPAGTTIQVKGAGVCFTPSIVEVAA
jgi:hypothetical protein